MQTKSFPCPYNPSFRIELDKGQVFKDDPGNGTPALVYGPKGSVGTYSAALDTGELACGSTVVEIPENVMNWLDTMLDAVDGFLYDEE